MDRTYIPNRPELNDVSRTLPMAGNILSYPQRLATASYGSIFGPPQQYNNTQQMWNEATNPIADGPFPSDYIENPALGLLADLGLDPLNAFTVMGIAKGMTRGSSMYRRAADLNDLAKLDDLHAMRVRVKPNAKDLSPETLKEFISGNGHSPSKRGLDEITAINEEFMRSIRQVPERIVPKRNGVGTAFVDTKNPNVVSVLGEAGVPTSRDDMMLAQALRRALETRARMPLHLRPSKNSWRIEQMQNDAMRYASRPSIKDYSFAYRQSNPKASALDEYNFFNDLMQDVSYKFNGAGKLFKPTTPAVAFEDTKQIYPKVMFNPRYLGPSGQGARDLLYTLTKRKNDYNRNTRGK